MSDEHVNWTKLISYLNGEASLGEEKEIEEWIAQNRENKDVLKFLEWVQKVNLEEKEDWNVDSAWKRYNARYGQDIKQNTERTSSHHTRELKSPTFSFYSLKIVAAAAILLISGFFVIQYITNDAVPVTQEITANNGELLEYEMNDGTSVTLNSGSKMQVRETESSREVELEGQAYFDVVSDSERPFIVNTSRSVTEVLGTRFDVNAYPENEQIRVVVEEGRVLFKGKTEDLPDVGIELTKNQIGYLSADGNTQVQAIDDTNEYLGWRNGRIQFNNQPISEVIASLERTYNVNIELSDSQNEVSENGFTGTFSAEQNISEVLNAISMVLDLDYQQSTSDSTYVLYK